MLRKFFSTSGGHGTCVSWKICEKSLISRRPQSEYDYSTAAGRMNDVVYAIAANDRFFDFRVLVSLPSHSFSANCWMDRPAEPCHRWLFSPKSLAIDGNWHFCICLLLLRTIKRLEPQTSCTMPVFLGISDRRHRPKARWELKESEWGEI